MEKVGHWWKPMGTLLLNYKQRMTERAGDRWNVVEDEIQGH